MLRAKVVLVYASVMVWLGPIAVAQDKEQIKKLTPTHRGSGGLFTTYVANTLRQGEFSLGIVAHEFHRDPNDLNFTVFPVSFQIGLFDFLEFFGAFEVYKRVRAGDLFVNKMLPGGALATNDVLGLEQATYETLGRFPPGYAPALLGDGRLGFYNDAPFMDLEFGDGRGDFWAGLKLNVLSERKGAPFSLAFQPIVKFTTADARRHVIRGLTAGARDYGLDAVITREFNNGATVTGNAGFMQAQDLRGIERQNRFNWGVGSEVKLPKVPVNVIAELVGSRFLGTKSFPLENVNSIVDFYGGIRMYPVKWMTFSAAASFHLRNAGATNPSVQGAGTVGFYTQVAFRRKINLPPTLQCSVDAKTVTEGELIRISASPGDPDNNSLAMTWKASGGRLAVSGTVAALDTSGLSPGSYAVTAQASDGSSVASCSVDIDVEKRKMAPSITCGKGSYSVTQGKSVSLEASASDPNGDRLSYSWAVDGQAVTNQRSLFEFGTTGRPVGRHKVRVTAADPDHMSASCEFVVTVKRKPNNAPVVSLELDRYDPYAGELVNATASGNDRDADPLTYSWKVDGQELPEKGNRLRISTHGMAAGSHSVTVTVTDDGGASASHTRSFWLDPGRP